MALTLAGLALELVQVKANVKRLEMEVERLTEALEGRTPAPAPAKAAVKAPAKAAVKAPAKAPAPAKAAVKAPAKAAPKVALKGVEAQAAGLCWAGCGRQMQSGLKCKACGGKGVAAE